MKLAHGLFVDEDIFGTLVLVQGFSCIPLCVRLLTFQKWNHVLLPRWHSSFDLVPIDRRFTLLFHTSVLVIRRSQLPYGAC